MKNLILFARLVSHYVSSHPSDVKAMSRDCDFRMSRMYERYVHTLRSCIIVSLGRVISISFVAMNAHNEGPFPCNETSTTMKPQIPDFSKILFLSQQHFLWKELLRKRLLREILFQQLHAQEAASPNFKRLTDARKPAQVTRIQLSSPCIVHLTLPVVHVFKFSLMRLSELVPQAQVPLGCLEQLMTRT